MGKVFDGNKESLKRRQDLDYFRFYVLVVVFGLCVLFYYFGEIVDMAGWKALRWGIFYSVHDLHRLLFLVPIVYAAYFFGVRAVIIVTILATASFMPRALFISPFPDPLLRTLIFVVIAGGVGYIIAVVRDQALKLKRERDSLLNKINDTTSRMN